MRLAFHGCLQRWPYEGDVKSTYQTLLRVMEHTGVPTQAQCREGYCGSCKCKLIDGQVIYIREPIGFTSDNEILSCCAVPVGDVELEVNM
ncbi:class I ribonucleotide reductase maintenance protein YfaE [Photobacterium sp. R1]